jgi:hypothetical protein
MINRPRIYADFNGRQQSPRDATRTAVPLDTFGSLRELSNAGVRLFEGMPLVIYMDSDVNEDLEADAVAYYAHRNGIWFAELFDDRIRYVPRPEEKNAEQFLCVECRLPVPAGKHGRPEVSVCPRCGTPVLTAINPPQISGRSAVT